MADKSAIEWTDASWTPIRARNLKTGKIGWHCEHDTTGCEFCYSEGFNKRLGTGLAFKPGHRKDIEIFLDEEMLLAPLRWKKPRKIFVCSMTDLFAGFVKDEWIDRVFAVMALCPQHTFQVLTKRAERMRAYCASDATLGRVLSLTNSWLQGDGKIEVQHKPDGLGGIVLPNVWLGVSTERQKEADERLPLLLQTPAAVRFISAEPLLGPITISYLEWARLDWVIVGGESGVGARECDIGHVDGIVSQCRAAGIPVFVKQLGAWPIERYPEDTLSIHRLKLKDKKGGDIAEWPECLRVRERPRAANIPEARA